ncbi:MAG: hypothetical protein A2Z81_05135 [Omnitrophica WOR_2 bacterium GWA2_45_18]|nr:MAG: hypothetical protein A2Z81_05135 [Omnitrophica WOR_2 bacterium GWA2_45_18]
MKNSLLITRFLFYGNRVMILYLFAWVFFHATIDHPKSLNAAKITVLNRLLPSFVHLTGIMDDQEVPDKKKLRGCIQYYEKVVLYMPQLAEAYGLLGFCYYHTGEKQKSLEAYKKAALLNPHFFWSHYNLGLIDYKEGRYSEAVESFQKALTTQPEVNIKIINTSMIYKQILLGSGHDHYDITTHLRNGYAAVRLLLILSYSELKALKQTDQRNNRNDPTAMLKEKINLRPF